MRKRILSDNIRRYMKANNLTELDLSAQSGIKYTTLNNWICCKTYPGQRNLIKLSAALKCEIPELTENETYQDERKKFLTIGQASILYAYSNDRLFQRICDGLLKFFREKRLAAYAEKILEILEINNDDN